jgi:hypothetical protein
VHDTTWFEIQGTPAVFLASTEFIDAAEKQAVMLGLPEVRRLFVPHPIQDANDDEMRARADAVVDQVIEALVD